MVKISFGSVSKFGNSLQTVPLLVRNQKSLNRVTSHILRYAQIAISNVLVKVSVGRAWSIFGVFKKDPSLLASSLFAKGDFGFW